MVTPLLLALALGGPVGHAAETPGAEAASSFTCGDRQTLSVRFGAVKAVPIAVVDVGDGPHALQAQPWDEQGRSLVWSDGRRTLTWSTGVHLMFMDGQTHLICGRAGGHHH